MNLPSLLGAALATALVLSPRAQEPARLLRYPHVQGDLVAFCSGGDIWTVARSGGAARRITSYDDGYEVFPRISPDGKWIAFSGEYTGSRQVWIVPSSGGEPRQLTFYPDVGPMPPRGGFDNLVFDWTPDGEKILVRSNRTPYGQRVGRYFLVDPDGGLEQPLQIPEGGPASFSPDGSRLAYNVISREWRTWKRYTAGRAQDVWIYDLDDNAIEQVTDFDGTDNWPLWLGDRIYYTSDRTGTLNLYAYDLTSEQTRAITSFDDWDVLFPSRGSDGIAFERGGDIWIMDAGTEQVAKLNVTLADDRPWRRAIWKEAGSSLGDVDLAADGEHVVGVFRGDVFVLPVGDDGDRGQVENVTATPDRREWNVLWAPDGDRIAYLAEDGDDYEIHMRTLPLGQELQLTDDTGAWILAMTWSPSGDHIAFTDKANRLSVVDVASREVTRLDTASESQIGSVQWSADSRWLTYTKVSPNGKNAVWICAASGGDDGPRQVTSDDWSDGSPSFDPDGHWLYFTSARDFRYGDFDFQSRIFALLLRDDSPDPTAPDELGDEKPAKSSEKDGAAAVRIDFDGIVGREVVLPEPSGSYFGLLGVDGGVLFARGGSLHRYRHDDRSSQSIASGFGWTFTKKRDRMAWRSGGSLKVGKISPGASGTDVDTGDVRVRIVPTVEWAQMYRDAWRIMRDWFYDPEMHRVDWTAMRDKHGELVPHIAHRRDLDFLLGELIGELNAGHTYVQPGETPSVDRRHLAGVLGCELVADRKNDRYRIGTIFDGENWNASTKNPLRVPGVDVDEGDYLLAIDGHELTLGDHPYRHLEGKVGRRVELLVNEQPRAFGARKVIVRPAASELGMRYVTWVNRNRRLVDELSGGRIGYLHAPNTGVPGHREVWEGWSSQSRVKDAMIIDDRYNGGGFIPDRMIYEIGKPVLNWWSRRGTELSRTPTSGFDGPMAMLINGYSSSGGDAFPYYFRKLGLGKLIGTTTWGGLIGYSGSPRLVDGGGLAVPAFSFVNTDGKWDVEAYGVAPDLEVFDDPTQIQAGREPVLEAAVKHLLEELEKRGPSSRPPVPNGPDRSGVGPGK